MKNKTKGKFTMRKRLKNILLACFTAAAMVVGTAPSMAYAEDSVGGTETAAVSEEKEIQGDIEAENTEADPTEESQFADDNTAEEAVSDEAGDPEENEEATEDLAKAKEPAASLKDKIKEGSLISYSGHIQSYGNRTGISDGASLGTTGESKRLEALSVTKGTALEDFTGDIVYRAHVQSYGTQEWKKNGEEAGTTGKAKRLEAIQMYLTGELAEYFDIYYCLHVQTFGWTKWVKGSSENDGWCGTSGLSKRVEAVQICLVAKDGGNVPANKQGAIVDYDYVNADSFGSISYSGHQQTYGDMGPVYGGALLGVTGQSKRLEALSVDFEPGVLNGSVSYRAHVQSYGWQNWVSDGALAGTKGQSKRLEAIQIKLEGDVTKYYDIYYRVHIQSYGWLGWAKNGEEAGSSGLGKRMEAIEIRLVPKSSSAPGSTANAYVTMTPQQQRILNACNKIYSQVGKDLYSCFNWCVNNIKYTTLYSNPSGGYTTSQYYALFGLEQGYGDCRTFAASFYWLAKNLGYSSAHYVYGYVLSASGGQEDHAWVEIDNYVFDASFQNGTKRNGYHFAYGTSGTWRYVNYKYYD